MFKIYKPILKLVIRNKKVYLGKKVKFNEKSYFQGYNKIYSGVNVVNSKIGLGTYISNNSKLINCNIGKFCSIASEVNTAIGRHPLFPFISTHPSFFSLKKQAGFTFVDENKFKEFNYISEKENISYYIGNDVWIGYGVTLIEGIKIGDGAIIAASSVVTKNIPPYEIWGGNPAKKLKDRFSQEDKEKLLKLKWWNKDLEWIKKNKDKFSNINKIKGSYD